MDNTLSKVGRPHPSDGPHTNLDHLDWKALAVTWVKQQLENLVKRCGKNGMVQPRLEAAKKRKEMMVGNPSNLALEALQVVIDHNLSFLCGLLYNAVRFQDCSPHPSGLANCNLKKTHNAPASVCWLAELPIPILSRHCLHMSSHLFDMFYTDIKIYDIF